MDDRDCLAHYPFVVAMTRRRPKATSGRGDNRPGGLAKEDA
jgi:hypothetical protein